MKLTLSKVSFLLVGIIFVQPTVAQDMSTMTCQIHEMVMGKQILPFRQQGIMPVGEAERMFNDENDVRTRVFLKQTVRNLYANPAGAERYLNSGQFLKDCVKVNRGY